MKWTTLLLTAAPESPAQVRIVIDKPMAPPDWARLERELLPAHSLAMDRLTERYLDDRAPHNARWITVRQPWEQGTTE